MSEQKIDAAVENIYKLIVKVNSKKNGALKDINVKIFRDEKDPISTEQWVENIKNGAAFKRLVLVANTDNEGNVTTELPAGSYEIKLETYGLSENCELTQNKEIILVEPKKSWW